MSEADEQRAFLMYYGIATDCRAGSDGDCDWGQCPQERDGEPRRSGRHCPLDKRDQEEA